MTHTEEFDLRARLIAGLRDLAVFLESHPDVPAPRQADLFVFPDGTDGEKRAEIDVIATRLGVKVAEIVSGHYTVSLLFGPVQYRAVAICQSCSHADRKRRDLA